MLQATMRRVSAFYPQVLLNNNFMPVKEFLRSMDSCVIDFRSCIEHPSFSGIVNCRSHVGLQGKVHIAMESPEIS